MTQSGEEVWNRKRKITVGYEIVMAILAIISVVTIWNETNYTRYIDFIIWLIFVIDVSVRFFLSDRKWDYVKKNPLDIIAIIPFDSVFRLARLARLFRVLRAILILKNHFKPLLEILRTNNLDKVILGLFVFIFVLSIPVQYFEPEIETYMDAVWWAIVTSTTVGYGDLSPETIIGRMIAVVLMIFGIGLLGLVTSAVATYFLQKGSESTNSTITYIKGEVDRLEELTDEEIDRLKVLLDTYKKEQRQGDG
ncbi:potassium channel family protein [Evansella clarkii]|uniref:potassium channel family protein n=1 Tax=Evansella clarkii TaxID=79879 RepID=UPI00099852D6|nr:potassium channel family protein [Evansella clarkii]